MHHESEQERVHEVKEIIILNTIISPSNEVPMELDLVSTFGPSPMQQHGFARNMDWSLVEFENMQGNSIFELKDGSYSHVKWSFSF